MASDYNLWAEDDTQNVEQKKIELESFVLLLFR